MYGITSICYTIYVINRFVHINIYETLHCVYKKISGHNGLIFENLHLRKKLSPQSARLPSCAKHCLVCAIILLSANSVAPSDGPAAAASLALSFGEVAPVTTSPWTSWKITSECSAELPFICGKFRFGAIYRNGQIKREHLVQLPTRRQVEKYLNPWGHCFAMSCRG